MNAAPSVALNVPYDSDIFGGEAGVVKALATVRQAAVSPETKDSLRNLFLSYAGESEEKKREEIKAEILSVLEKEPQLSAILGVKTEKPTPSTTQNSLGRTRPVPSFSVTPVTPPMEKVETPPASVEKMEEPVVEVAVKAPEIPVTPPEPVPPAPMATDTNIKARIDAIKHDINSKIGNPVNLINADEAIGREYMSALLGAMKQASVGGGAEALTRLDVAYQAALNLIREKGLGSQEPTAVKSEEVPEAPKTPEEPPTPVPPPPPPAQPVQMPVLEIKLTPPPPVQSEGLYHRPSDEVEEAGEPKEEGLSSFASRFFKAAGPEKKEADPTAPSESPLVKKVEVNAEKVPAPDKTSEPDTLKPLKETATALPEKMAALKQEAAKREVEAKKPITDLKSPEVEAGLKQLLSEWVLFKKSGFLGTGPSGINHPLYKQLSTLPMAAVVSGRFEGVTPEIKRHLSDYMTGWRYEQGIMHEMGETFENYLRRVIRQILEKQRKESIKAS